MRICMALCCTLFAGVSRAASPETTAQALVVQQASTATADDVSSTPIEGATSLDVELLLNAPVITATGREQSRALTPENIVLNGEELDQAVDAAIAGQPIPAGKREGYAWAAAVDNLRRHQVQQDNDGIAVTVSREALEQVLALFPKVPPQP